MPGVTRKRAEPKAKERACALVVFARAPVPGRVKTRLVPLLGKRGAAYLQARMLAKTLRTARSAGFDPVLLFSDAQGPGDLGSRMHRAFARFLRQHESAILIGSDCPALSASDLRAAARALKGGASAVLSPAEDGGYALIGLRRSSRQIFSGVDWGASRVLAQTRSKLKRLGWQWKELRTVWDVDRPEDLARLRRERLL